MTIRSKIKKVAAGTQKASGGILSAVFAPHPPSKTSQALKRSKIAKQEAYIKEQRAIIRRERALARIQRYKQTHGVGGVLHKIVGTASGNRGRPRKR